MRISVEETPEFEKDIAYYSISEERHERIKAHLSDNPVAGRQHPDDTTLREWELGEEIVTFMFVPEVSTVILLRIQPRTEPRGRVLKKAKDLLEILNQIKALFLNW